MFKYKNFRKTRAFFSFFKTVYIFILLKKKKMCQIQNENQTQKRKIETKNKTNTIIPPMVFVQQKD